MIKSLKKTKTAKKNPKKRCKTIRVKRKVSMGIGKKPKILRVKRKICNPEEVFDLAKYTKKYPKAKVTELRRAYLWAVDTQNDNSHDNVTWKAYFPYCIAEIMSDKQG